MSSSPIAQAMRLWQDMLGQEHETRRSFLWENVQDMEPDEAGPIEWKNQEPKTRIYLQSGQIICVLGEYEHWLRLWSAYAMWNVVPIKQYGLN
jgi:hypothetical protein